MKKNSEKADIEEDIAGIRNVPDGFLDHLYWASGFLEKQNENIMNRGTALIGFCGVEIALILGMLNSTPGLLEVVPIGLFLVTIGLFLKAIWTQESSFSHGDSFRNLLEMPPESQTLAMCQHILKFDSPKKSLIDGTISMISKRGKYLRCGYWSLATSQLSFFLSILLEMNYE